MIILLFSVSESESWHWFGSCNYYQVCSYADTGQHWVVNHCCLPSLSLKAICMWYNGLAYHLTLNYVRSCNLNFVIESLMQLSCLRYSTKQTIPWRTSNHVTLNAGCLSWDAKSLIGSFGILKITCKASRRVFHRHQWHWLCATKQFQEEFHCFYVLLTLKLWV